MRAGLVTSDKQAFDQVLRRLEGDVGGTLALVAESRAKGGDIAPIFQMLRMMFPIAESIGDLIHHNEDSSVQNLKDVLKNEFEAVRPGRYRRVENTLPILYRHSLTHTDEMRSLQTKGTEATWCIACGDDANHLEVWKTPNKIVIQFDPCAFYKDIVNVVKTAMSKSWGGQIKDRYNSWLTLNLDALPKKYKDAIAEIATLVTLAKSK
jgi:hypothetical protein